MNSAMDAYGLRQRTIAKNIANVNSPHYRPEKVKFEEFFHQQEVVLKGASTDNFHIPVGVPNPNVPTGEVNEQEVPGPQVYFSGETHVNIDKEMAELAQNQIKFRFASNMVGKFFRGLTSAITGTNGQA